jgi:hypothetical protein
MQRIVSIQRIIWYQSGTYMILKRLIYDFFLISLFQKIMVFLVLFHTMNINFTFLNARLQIIYSSLNSVPLCVWPERLLSVNKPMTCRFCN